MLILQRENHYSTSSRKLDDAWSGFFFLNMSFYDFGHFFKIQSEFIFLYVLNIIFTGNLI